MEMRSCIMREIRLKEDVRWDIKHYIEFGDHSSSLMS